MKPRQKILALVIAAEAVAWVGFRFRGVEASAPPIVRKEALDPLTIQQIERLERALRPAEATDWARLAEVYRAFNLLGAAEYCYRQVDRLAPAESEHLFDWAITLSRLGDTRQATRICERIVAQGGPRANESRLLQARDRLREENPSAAETLLRQLKDSPDASLLLTRLLIRTGRAKEAESILESWLQGAPDELRARQMRSWAAAALGDGEEALRHRLIALRCRNWSHQADPTSGREQQMRQNFGRAAILEDLTPLETQSKWDEAAALLREALAIAWNDQDARHLAEVEMKAGRPQRAVDELEKLIRTTGASGENLLALSRVWLAQGDTQKAFELLSRAESLGGNNSALGNLQIQQALGSMAAARNDPEAARVHQARAQFELGKVSWSENNIAQAQQQFFLSTNLWPGQAHAWFYLGETSALLGDVARARQSYQRCLQLQPNHGRAVEAMKRLR